MTFLNPIVLLGLIASSIPIIIHLLNLRKLKKVEFSTLAFLKELQKNKIRKIKIKQILLLILRTLIIILLVFIFSRPVIKGYLSEFGSHTKTSVVIILDDTYSMNIIDENGLTFKQAKNTIEKITNLLEEGDELSIIKLSDLPKATLTASSNFSGFGKELEGYQPGYKNNTFSTAVKLASAILAESKNFNKEIYLVSDFQKNHFALGEEELKSTLYIFDNNTKIYSIKVGKKETGNLAIDNVQIKNKIFRKDKPVNLDAVIKNYGMESGNNVASVYLEGKRVTQKSVNVSGNSTVSLSITPRNYGYLKGFVEVEDDALPVDNKRYFTLYVPEKIRILMVQKNKEDGALLKIALKVANQKQDSVKGGDIFEIDDASAITPVNLSKYEVVVLNNAPPLAQAEIQKLKTFSESGGGIMIFPGSTPPSNELDPLFRELGIGNASGSQIAGRKDSSKTQSQAYVGFSRLDFDHPILSDIFEDPKTRNKGVESPEIYQFVSYRFNNLVQSIIEMSNNSPFFAESRKDNQKILIFSVAPNLEWSNFPLKGLYLPLIYRSVFYLANKSEDNMAIKTGESPALKFRMEYLNKECSLIDPDGVEEKISFLSGSGDISYNFTSSNKPGIYDIVDGKQVIRSIAANLNPEEADLKKISGTELDVFLKAFGLNEKHKEISAADDIKQILEESRYGVEVWKTLLIILIILVIAEMLIARDSKKQIADLNI